MDKRETITKAQNYVISVGKKYELVQVLYI